MSDLLKGISLITSQVRTNQDQGPAKGVKPKRFLYLKNIKEDGVGIELKSALKDEANRVEGLDDGLKEIKGLFDAILGSSDEEITNMFNSRLRGLTAKTKHEVAAQDFPKEGELGSKSNPLKPTKDDYMSPGGRLDPYNSLFNHDGKTFPLTILVGGDVNEGGMPEVLHLQDGMSFDGKFQNIWYIDPKTNKPTKGVYFEATESKGPKGAGGKNGVIAPEGLLPLAVMKDTELTDQTKIAEFEKDPSAVAKEGYFRIKEKNKTYYLKAKEAWFIGVKESQQRLDPAVKSGLNLDVTA